MIEPAYLRLSRRSSLEERAEVAIARLGDCHVCPRACAVNRLAGETGTCNTGRYAIISSAFSHHGEEDCLRGTRGSGTIFFSECSLRCVFCQNWDISQGEERGISGVDRALGAGRICDPRALADLMLALQKHGCHNINLVTPSHVVPQIIEAVAEASRQGLHLPLVYNTGGYDSIDSLRLLDGLIDIYMPDFKFWRPETGARLAGAADYAERARQAFIEMHRQVGPLEIGIDGIARRGVLVRHLVIPGLVDESAAIFEWLARELSSDTYVNVMGQYRPECYVGRPGPDGRRRYEEIDRRPTPAEMRAAFDGARRAGLHRFA